MRSATYLSVACALILGCHGGSPSGGSSAAPAATTTAPAAVTSWTLGSSAPSQPAPSATASAPIPTDPLARADYAATKLVTTLKTKLRNALDRSGTVGAIDVCANQVPIVTAEVRKETGVTVGRSSSKLRNPKDTAPEWVAAWLKEQGDRSVGGVKSVREIVDGPSGKISRVLRPISLETPCLGCHGDPSEILPAVKEKLAAEYPSDTAMGYKIGDLRGAVWAEYPIPK